jgi:hypothetical protein
VVSIYLWLNALIYVLFAGWCAISPGKTASAIGYAQLDPSGRSEYLVVYGGLQLGIGLFFAYCAYASQQRWGMLLALLIYVPIVLFRVATVWHEWPVSPTTLAVGAMELLLLIGALLLARSADVF